MGQGGGKMLPLRSVNARQRERGKHILLHKNGGQLIFLYVQQVCGSQTPESILNKGALFYIMGLCDQCLCVTHQ